MRTRPLLLVALLLLAPLSAQTTTTACPQVELALAGLVSQARAIVVGEVVAIREAAGEEVAEVRVIDLLKGEVVGDSFLYPLRSIFRTPDGKPTAGEQAVLFLGPDDDFEGTRAFWKALDRLRGRRPFYDVAPFGIGRLPIVAPVAGGQATVQVHEIELPVEVLAWVPDGADPESPRRVVDAWTLVEAIRTLAVAPAPAGPSGPGTTGFSAGE